MDGAIDPDVHLIVARCGNFLTVVSTSRLKQKALCGRALKFNYNISTVY
jgi:hypothetical protein